MSNFIKISDAASIALHSMAFMAANEGISRVADISSYLGVSEFHLSKVLQRLSKSKLVNSTRGPGGGFKLEKNSKDISLLEVYEAIDGQLSETRCLLDVSACKNGKCILGNTLTSIAGQFKDYLSKTALSELDDVFEKNGG